MERRALFCDTSARMSERPSHDWLRRVLATLGLIACVLVVLWPVWSEGRYPITHEAAYGDRYAVLVGHFKAALDAGVWYPRWLPDLKGGYGYPTFVFYQPAFFFVAGRVAQVSALGLAKATYVAVALFLFFGAVGAYLAARERSGRLFSLFGAAFFLFTPWICTNLYVRGDLSELTSVMALPWVTLFVIQVAERIRAGVSPSRALVGLSFALALVIYSHPTTALSTFAVVPLLGLGVVGDLPERRLRALIAFAAAYVAALALAAPYWLPVMQLKSLVRLEGATTDYYLTYRHLLEPLQLFARTFEFGSSALDSPNDTMPFQAGLVQVVLAVLGFVVARRQWSSRVMLIVYVGLLFMMTTSAAFIWKNVGALAIFQFPWRLLSPVTWLQWWLVLGLSERAWSRLNVAAGVVATAVTLAWGANQFHTNPGLPLSFAEMDVRLYQESFDLLLVSKQYANQDEFLPRTASEPAEGPRRQRPMLESPEPNSVVELPGHSAYRVHAKVTLAAPAQLKLNQFYFPGWRVMVNGVDQVPTLLPDGRMQLSLSGGEAEIEAWYGGPPSGGVRLLVMGAVLAACVFLVRRLRFTTA